MESDDARHDPSKPRADEPETYDLAPEDPASRPAPAAMRSPAAAGSRAPTKAIEPASVDEDDSDGADGDRAAGSLPPPISRSAAMRPWLVVAGASMAVLAISWLAGAPQLGLPVGSGADSYVPELDVGARLVGLARTFVYLPLATLGATFGFLALAFVRQRPVGHVGALLAKSAAIVSIGMLVWLVPSEVRFIKQILNTVVVPAIAGACAVPVLRLSPRDAALATGFGLMGMLFLVLASAVVVWAVGA